jgi:CrcB protein
VLIALLMLAGAIGAPARYLVDGLVQDRAPGAFPLGTYVINVTGSFVLGVITGLVLYHALPSVPKTVLGTGFCGAYTTFSTYTYESIRLAEEGDWGEMLRNLAASLGTGVVAAGLGMFVASL